MNSMLAMTAPARQAIATPSPVAIVGVGRVEINFAASAGREDQPIGSDGFHHAGNFIEHVNPEAMILGRKAKFRGRDEIDRHMILEQLNIRRTLDRAEECRLDFVAGEVVHVEDAAFRMAAFAPEVELAMPGDIPLVKVQAEFHQFMNPRRAFLHHRLDRRRIAQARARLERVANMQLEGIFAARHAGHTALRPGGVRVHAFALGDNRDPAVLRRLDRKSQAGNPAPDHDEIKLSHPMRMLSISRVLPKKTATARSERGSVVRRGCRSSAPTISA